METKKLKFQTVAAGNQGTVDATIVEGENKENNAAKTAGMAAAGIAAGAAVGYAGYEVYQQFAGTVEAEPMTADDGARRRCRTYSRQHCHRTGGRGTAGTCRGSRTSG